MNRLIFPLTLRKVLFWLFSIVVLACIFHPPTRYVVYDLRGKFLTQEELALRDQEQILKNRARNRNMSLREYKKNLLALEANKNLRERVEHALRDGDLTSLDALLSQIKVKQEIEPDIYKKAIENNLPGALTIIHKYGFNCKRILIDERTEDDWYYDTESEQGAYKAISRSSSPELVAEWISLGCHYRQNDFIKYTIKGNKGFKLDLVPITQENSDLWHEAITRSVEFGKEDFAAKHIANVLANTSNDGEFALVAAPQLNQERRDILEDAIYKGMPKVVNAILDANNNYIHQAGSVDSVMRLLSQRPLNVPIDSFLRGRLNLKQVENELPAYWSHAVDRGDVGMLRLLMTYDSSFNLMEYKSDKLKKMDLRLRSNDVTYFTTLIDIGLDYTQFEYQGLDQLSHAVSLGDAGLVSSILEAGVNPSFLYRGKSILMTPIRAGIATQQKIKSLLKEKGATVNISKLTSIKDDSVCSAGKKVALSDHNKNYYVPVKEYMSKQSTLSINTNRVCEITLGVCTGHDGFSLDDCFESVRTCSRKQDERGYENRGGISTVCCPEFAKQTYNEKRCSGLTPKVASEQLVESGLDIVDDVSTYLNDLY